MNNSDDEQQLKKMDKLQTAESSDNVSDDLRYILSSPVVSEGIHFRLILSFIHCDFLYGRNCVCVFMQKEKLLLS